MEKIKGIVKNYDWGGYDYLPELLGLQKTGAPHGEYWLGTHPDGMSTSEHDGRTLSDILGHPLPFILKVLDVRSMLSIQVHPDKSTAEKGFEREELAGIHRSSPLRTYKDKNHKPELMVALSRFWLVQGFKTGPEISEQLRINPEFKLVFDFFEKNGLKKTYSWFMNLPQEEINKILKPLGQRIKPLYEKGILSREDIHFWAARAFLTFNKKGFCDPGILSLYLMNLVHLQPGEAVFQAPGVLHAYLEGQNLECMATSDNVVRGGLTNKHMDVRELIKMVNFQPEPLRIIKPVKSDEGFESYPAPVPEFELIRFTQPASFTMTGEAILINLGDSINVISDQDSSTLRKGKAVLLKEVNEKKRMVQIDISDNSKVLVFVARGKSG